MFRLIMVLGQVWSIEVVYTISGGVANVSRQCHDGHYVSK